MANSSGALVSQAAFDTQPEIFQGQPCQRLTLPSGDSVLVALQGAHLLSWVAQGRERLFLSERNVWDGQAAIRGGVPVCFPQFNQRGDLPKHGFARNVAWQFVAGQVDNNSLSAKHVHSLDDFADIKNNTNSSDINFASGAHMRFQLTANAQTLALWPQQFVATLHVSLKPNQLQITLQVQNTDTRPLLFTGALHTYFAVHNIANTQLTGLQGQAEWNAVTDQHGTANEVLRFDGEFDRVYQAAPHALQLQDANGTLQIEQSPSWGQSVVWNPGATKCATLSDMPPDGYQHMLCVEAAQVYEPISVAPSQTWQGWQRLSLV
jgi:glucose-6-phosphate 1-epimerase